MKLCISQVAQGIAEKLVGLTVEFPQHFVYNIDQRPDRTPVLLPVFQSGKDYGAEQRFAPLSMPLKDEIAEGYFCLFICLGKYAGDAFCWIASSQAKHQ